MCRPLRVALLLLPLLGCSAALHCFACKNDAPIAGIKLAQDISDRLGEFPSCAEFKQGTDGARFQQECAASEQSCIFVTDPDDETNMMRSCFPLKRDVCAKQACYCTTDLCNAAARGAGGSVAALTALLAALVLVLG